MNFKKLALSFFALLFLCACNDFLSAQVTPSAFRSPISLTVGGTVSAFNPDYVQNKMIGVGGFVDLNLFHGVGVEAEGRWLRFREPYGISQDNYLIGPRVQLHHLWHFRPYVKALGGFSEMTFEDNIAQGRFTTFEAGGGLDYHLTRRISVRGEGDFQWWPEFLGSSLTPYGVSAGVGYRIF